MEAINGGQRTCRGIADTLSMTNQALNTSAPLLSKGMNSSRTDEGGENKAVCSLKELGEKGSVSLSFTLPACVSTCLHSSFVYLCVSVSISALFQAV